MNQRTLLGLLFRPSLSSAIISLAVAGAVLIGASWSFVAQNVLFDEYFIGPDGLVTILHESPDGTSAFVDAIFAKSFVYNIVVLLVAALAGIVVYVLLQAISKLLEGVLGGVLAIREISGQSKKALEAEIGTRVGIRLVVLVLWLMYGWFFAKILLPFCILASYTMANDLQSWEGWSYGLLSFVLLAAGLHVHVIFARLFLLRPRLFGIRGSSWS